MAQGLETLAGFGRTVFRNNRIDEICLLKSPCQQQCIFSVAPCQRRYACHDCKPLEKSWAHNFSGESHWWNLSWKPELSPSYFPRFPIHPPCRRSFSTQLSSTLSSLPSRSFRTELSPSYSPRFPLRPSRRFHLAPSPRTSPQAISHSLPPCHRFHIAPSQRSSPQAISHSFPSVHPVVASISLLPHGALPKLFPTVSFPSTLSSFPYRPFPTELSPSYFPRFPFRPACRRFHPFLPHRAPPMLFPTVSPPSTLSSLPSRSFLTELSPRRRFHPAPSPRSSPRDISHGFLSVHPLIASVSLLPNGALPMLFPTVSCPSTLSSLPYRSFPTELSPSYFPRLPFRPPSRRFHLAPSPRSSFQAISHGFPSVHPVVAYFPLLPHGALPKLFPTGSSPSTQSSLPSVPSQRTSPQAISHGFPSVHPLITSVSLPRGKFN